MYIKRDNQYNMMNEVDVGKVFTCNDSIYLKVPDTIYDGLIEFNAFNLNTNEFEWIDEDRFVKIDFNAYLKLTI